MRTLGVAGQLLSVYLWPLRRARESPKDGHVGLAALGPGGRAWGSWKDGWRRGWLLGSHHLWTIASLKDLGQQF